MTANIQRWKQLYQKYSEHTMIWEPMFWENLDLCAEYHCAGHAVVECGVWKGGMIAAIAEAIQDPAASYHLFDSFQGLPEAQNIDGEAALKWQGDKESPIYHDNCRADLEDATEAMSMAGTDNAHFHAGWFEETLSDFKCDAPISILRLDADWYASTILCLEALYPQLVPGGILIIDDFYTWDGCAKAIYDYFSKNGIVDRIESTSHKVAYCVKR